ncbi:hypothetical protein CMO89_00650 [Candidatus Woesearchaeota archaeon]|nr:hypothetical protein [Candidatus Woesearchaeota archaeon]|tara:strand:+ start:6405 stop:7103 length:699 start_codon:yes stop_codon:yes gene_type:complete
MIKRVPTGIPGFDKMVKGGFKEKSINLVCGPAGTGKSTFAIQFLVNGIIGFNENCVYITFEEERNQIISNMLQFGWDLEELEKSGKFVLLQYAPEMVKELVAEGGGVLDETIEKVKGKRIVIDSISSFSLLYQNEYERKQACLKLFELIRRWGYTAVFTAEDELVHMENAISTELEFEADSMVFLYNAKTKGKRKRAIEVVKMRGTKHVRKVLGFDITEKGIVINPNDVVEV